MTTTADDHGASTCHSLRRVAPTPRPERRAASRPTGDTCPLVNSTRLRPSGGWRDTPNRSGQRGTCDEYPKTNEEDNGETKLTSTEDGRKARRTVEKQGGDSEQAPSGESGDLPTPVETEVSGVRTLNPQGPDNGGLSVTRTLPSSTRAHQGTAYER